MTQRWAFATAAALLAFVVVLLGALGVYVTVANPAPTTTAAPPAAPPQDTARPAPLAPQQAAPGGEDENEGQGQTTYPVSADAAATIALTNAPGATLAQPPRLVNVNGLIVYEVTLDLGYDYIDTNSGQALYNSAGNPTRRRGRP